MNEIVIPTGTRGLVFDLDGTIADTMPLHYEAWVDALRGHGPGFPEALFYEMAGVPTARIMEILNEKHGYLIPVEEAAARKDALFEEKIPAVMAIEPVVAVIRAHAGRMPMAVATGGTRAVCVKTLVALGLSDYFRAVVTADDVEHGKPSPDIFLEAAKRLGLAAGECCAFEDGDLGIEAARRAGMPVIDVRPWAARRG